MLASVRLSLKLMSKADRRKYYLLVVLRAISGLFDILGILLIGLIAGLLSLGADTAKQITVLGYSFSGGNQQSVFLLAICALLAFSLKAICAISIIRFTNYFLASVESKASIDLCSKIFSGDLSAISRNTKSEIMWMLGPAASAAYSGLLISVSIFISEGVLLLLILTVFAAVDIFATIFVMLYFLAIVFVIQRIVKSSVQKAAENSTAGNIKSNATLEDIIVSFKELNVLGRMSFYLERFRSARVLKSQGDASHNLFLGMPRYIIETSLMFGVVLFVGFQYFSGNITDGLVVVGVFLTGGVRIMGSLLPIQNASTNIRSQIHQAALFYEAVDVHNKSKFLPNNLSTSNDFELQVFQPVPLDVKVINVSFTYPGSDIPALTDINLSIEAGSYVAIIGPSGSGKSTLVDLILGLLAPTSGEVQISSQNPSELISNNPGKISYVPQKPGIVYGSIAENVALGIDVQSIDEQRVRNSLEQVGLLDFVDSLQDGINSNVGLHSNSLSGGQIQRLGLARALYPLPSVLVLDEATSALDASAESIITENISKLNGSTTVIVIAHRLSTIQNCEKVFVVREGKIANSGTFTQLMKNDKLVAEYVKLMSFDN